MARDYSPHSGRHGSPRRRSRHQVESSRNRPKMKIAWEPETKNGEPLPPPVTKGEACCFYMKKKGFKYIAFIAIAHVWALIGGAIIMKIEEKHEAKLLRENIELEHNASKELTTNISEYFKSEYNCVTANSTKTEIQIYNSIHKPLPENHYPWNYAGSVFYCITLITTIGYGNQIARTTWGQVFTILFSLVGVPMFLTALNAVANLMTPVIKVVWERVRPCCCFVCNKMGRKRIQREETDGVLTTEDLDEMEEYKIPIYVALFLFLVWSLIWAFIFTLVYKGWSFFTSFYFLFITNTTIGLGDIVPPNALSGLTVFPILLVSLALISMTISVFTECVEDKLEDYIFEDWLGWDTDTSEEEANAKAKGKTAKPQAAKGGITLGVFQQRSKKPRAVQEQVEEDYDDHRGSGRHRRIKHKKELPSRSTYLRMKTRSNQTGGTYVKKQKREWGMSLARGPPRFDRGPRSHYRRDSFSGRESDFEDGNDGIISKLRRNFGSTSSGYSNNRSRSY